MTIRESVNEQFAIRRLESKRQIQDVHTLKNLVQIMILKEYKQNLIKEVK